MSFKEVVFSICLLSTECHKAVGTVFTLFHSRGVGSDITPHSSSVSPPHHCCSPRCSLLSPWFLFSCCVRISASVFGFLVQRWARGLRSSSLALSKPCHGQGAPPTASAHVTLVSSLCTESFHIKHSFHHHFFTLCLLELLHGTPTGLMLFHCVALRGPPDVPTASLIFPPEA